MVERIYWDACVFLAFINRDAGHLEIIDELLALARKKQLHIVSSQLSIVEVAFAASEQQQKALSPEQEAKIDSLWTDRTAITMAEVHPGVQREARALIRTGLPNEWKLKPADAIHLATAKLLGVSEIHTIERGAKWKRYEPQVGCAVELPRIPATLAPPEEPSTSGEQRNLFEDDDET